MAADREVSYPEYPVFKGLQRPLEFMGFQGRYIYWMAGAVGGAILSFLVCHILSGFLLGLIVATVILAVGGIMTFLYQRKGLHSKKKDKGIFIFHHSFLMSGEALV